MSSLFLAAFGVLAYALGYWLYSRYVALRVFGIDPQRRTPAHTRGDGVDFVPTNPHVLFGHHFTSVAGAAPILGPAIAVIWGWVPALLWVVFGSVFIGAVHDFGTLFVSTRNGGSTIADLTGRIMGPRARLLFLLLVLFLAWIVIAVFAVAIGSLFVSYPATVLPVNVEVLVAVAIGLLIYKRKTKLLVPSLVALGILWAMVWVGTEFTAGFQMPVIPGLPEGRIGQIQTWVVLLLAYSFVTSILPVWVLLQPRDYINSHQLFTALGALYLALVLYNPPVVAPAFDPSPAGAGPWFPLLFITVACGAISGFHGLVGSGTTSKQVDNELHTRPIGYGAALGEGLLALMAVICCTAGFASEEAWKGHYHHWDAAVGMGSSLKAFVDGGASFLWNGLGLPTELGQAVIAVVVISFAATTLDTCTRIQRFVLQELTSAYELPALQNRYVTSAVAAFTPLVLIFGGRTLEDGSIKPFWQELWPIFGASNQMLGGLSLLVLTFYLIRRGKNFWIVAVPTVFLTCMTSFAMVVQLRAFWDQGAWLLVGLTLLLLSLSAWILLEGVLTLRKMRAGAAAPTDLA